MLLKKTPTRQDIDQKHKSDRLTRAHNEKNVTTVKELVAPLRHEDQKRTHRLTSQVFKRTNLT